MQELHWFQPQPISFFGAYFFMWVGFLVGLVVGISGTVIYSKIK